MYAQPHLQSIPNSEMFMNEFLKTRHCIVAIYQWTEKPIPVCAGSHRGQGLVILTTFDERIGTRGNGL